MKVASLLEKKLKYKSLSALLGSTFVLALTLTVSLSLGLGGVVHAASNYPEICAQSGNGYCLNDWNGNPNLGAPVKMYTAKVANDVFSWSSLPGYCSDGDVSTSPACPFKNGSGLNTEFNGAPMVEIQAGNDLCLGTDSSGNANLGACPNPNGKSTGSNIWVLAAGCNPYNAGDYSFVNVYWSNIDGSPQYLISGGAIGAQAYVQDGVASCWGENI